MHVNLLPAALHQQLVIRRSLRQWWPWWCAVATALAAYLGLSWWQLSIDEREVAAIEVRQAEWAKMKQEMVDFLHRVSAAQKQHDLWRPAEESTVALPLLVALSQSVQAARGEVQVQQCHVSPAPEAAATPPGQPKPVAASIPGRSVTLGGTALSDVSLMDFVKALKEIGKFKKVEIKSLASSPRGPGLREWRLDCSL